MNVQRIAGAAVTLALLLPGGAPAAAFQDVLETPSVASALATRSLINALALAGDRLVGVGQRGHIVFSDDQGASWRQAQVPVSSDLVAVSFASRELGWAVGHDGVILHSSDAGASWSRQLDGRALGEVLLAHYRAAGDEAWIREAERFAEQGAENPFLDVWFADEANGFVVGAFNLILRTSDGGQSWTPWLDRTDNPQALHLYDIGRAGEDIYITGEQGLVLRLDAAAGRFEAVPTPYKGSFFGLVGTGQSVIVFGLRGNAWRSTDRGASWVKLETGVQEGITAGVALGEGGVLLASQAGRLLLSRDAGTRFAPVKLERALPAAAVQVLGTDAVAVGGPRGLAVQALRTTGD